MIKIKKSDNPPLILTTNGVAEKDSNNTLYDQDPEAYQTGEKKFDIQSNIYGHKTVKEQLKAEQFQKCCFCEAKFTANGFGDVEHFRPKGGYQQKMNGKIKKPGYYWKAYDWDNLFFTCQICNTSYKKNYFPVKDEDQRAISHHDDIAKELPLLIHPALDDPEKHLGFREEVCFDRDEKGKTSLSAFGINRKELLEDRRNYLNNVRDNCVIASLESKTIEEKRSLFSCLNMTDQKIEELIINARKFINEAAKDHSPFAAMVRNNFPDLPS